MKKYKYIFTDLDGTLYNMYPEPFTELYNENFANFLKDNNYDENESKKLIKAFWKMRDCDGEKLVIDIFYDYLKTVSNITRQTWEKLLLNFYNSEYYQNCSKVCSQNENMKLVIKTLKEKNYPIYLTTNPVFYKVALEKRVEWAGLNPSIFEYITSFENHYYTKPYKEYFLEIVKKYNLPCEDILMIGNDTYDDTEVEKLGIDCYIVTDNLINRSEKEIQTKYHSNSETLLNLVQKEF